MVTNKVPLIMFSHFRVPPKVFNLKKKENSNISLRISLRCTMSKSNNSVHWSLRTQNNNKWNSYATDVNIHLYLYIYLYDKFFGKKSYHSLLNSRFIKKISSTVTLSTLCIVEFTAVHVFPVFDLNSALRDLFLFR